MCSAFKAAAGWFQRPTGCLSLLRFCGSFCKMVHLARSTPPSLVAEVLSIFDLDISRCFTECTSVDVFDVAWQQAQLSPNRGGLGLRSLLHHSCACFIASIGHSGIALGENHHLEQSIDEFNGYIVETEAICLSLMLLSAKGTCRLR